ncbi:hypothetical protein [Evansella cellulosilytica]|uniref:Uncharacterized protein n=1 Tax=Evansella cellulosilytica (strain ATCC 21833 / DSM 2522 / FERM P-1141 / JCM 9156 / N-4) TaxID=649639 RepID=E6TSA9_EVAC2|nr:hypothetical protein [Evansella cellulosilytica]ADU31878.1 hypothetical protein Bcell_3637 [Evansella cellulosilytica DSM 2522]
MDADQLNELTMWKEELEARKAEIENRQLTIEAKLSKYKTRLQIASTINEDEKSSILEELRKIVGQYKNELEEFLYTNKAELVEIKAILKRIEERLEDEE